jgi:FkbM family methyltransferase
MSNNIDWARMGVRNVKSPKKNKPLKNHDVTWDGFTYKTNCPMFSLSIGVGQHTPYTGDLDIINKYIEETGRNQHCVDVGGHIGTHALPFSRIFEKVSSFEPTKDNFLKLEENIKDNNVKNITAYNVALGKTSGKISMFKSGSHNTGQRSVKEDDNGDTDLKTMDSFHFTSVDFIKIDVENYEMNVILGALNTIRIYKPLIQLENSNKEIEELLYSEGYKIHQEIHMDTFFRHVRD